MDEYIKATISRLIHGDKIDIITDMFIKHMPNGREIINVVTNTSCCHGTRFIKYSIKPDKITRECYPGHDKDDGNKNSPYPRPIKDISIFETIKQMISTKKQTNTTPFVPCPDITSCSFFDIHHLARSTNKDECIKIAKKQKEKWENQNTGVDDDSITKIVDWYEQIITLFKDDYAFKIYKMGINIAKNYSKSTFPICNALDKNVLLVQLVLFIISEEGYVRTTHNTYKAIPIYSNSRVRHLQRYESLKALIAEIISLHDFPLKITDYITKVVEEDTIRFPISEIERRWIGFRNGIFDMYESEFIKTEDIERKYGTKNVFVIKYYDELFPIDRFIKDNVPTKEELKELVPGDIKSVAERLLKSLKIEGFKKICEEQLWDVGMAFTIFSEWGRMSCDFKDYWETMLILAGKRNTGKSQLLKMLLYFVHEDDIYMIAKKMDESFNMEDAIGKSVIVSDDMFENPKVSSKIFNYILGDTKQTISTKWKKNEGVHLSDRCVVACNVPPIFRDITDIESVTRRWVLIFFAHCYTNDPNIDDNHSKIMEEMKCDILVAISRCYYISRYWRDNITPNTTGLRGEKLHRSLQIFQNREWATKYIKKPYDFKTVKDVDGFKCIEYPLPAEHGVDLNIENKSGRKNKHPMEVEESDFSQFEEGLYIAKPQDQETKRRTKRQRVLECDV